MVGLQSEKVVLIGEILVPKIKYATQCTNVKKLTIKPLIILQLHVLCFLLFLSSNVFASHSDDQCPDEHVSGGQSINVLIENTASGEASSTTTGVKPGDTVRVHGVATAEGYCQTYIYDPLAHTCVTGFRYERTVNHIHFNVVKNTNDNSKNYSLPLGSVFSTTGFDHTLNSQDASSSTGGILLNLADPGVYTIKATNIINITGCLLSPDIVEAEYQITVGNGDKDKGCPKEPGDLQANPCNPATGDKFQIATDYFSPNLSFTRYYNSQLDFAVGLGYGWTSNHHQRLIHNLDGSISAYRQDGRSEPFTKSGNNWNHDPDGTNNLAEDASGFTITRADGATERYSLEGNIQSVTETTGQMTNYTYNPLNQLEKVTGPYGHELIFTYNVDGLLETLTDPDNQTITYGYDTYDNLTSVTYQDNTVVTYHYENPKIHYLTGITDENNNRYATFDYQGDKNTVNEHAITTNTINQERFNFDYNNWPTNTTYTDGNGISTKITMASNLGRTLITEKENLVDNKKLTRIYDSNNNLTQVTDEDGHITKYTYNSTNQKTSTTEAFGTTLARTTSYEYLSPDVDLITKVTTPSVYTGHTSERILAYADPDVLSPTYIAETGYKPDGTPVVRAISLTYTTSGQLATIDGPRDDVSDITTYDYYNCSTGNECGQLKTITDALGHVTTFNSYDAHGRVTKSTDPNGIVTDTVYDLRGRVTSITLTAPSLQSRAISYIYDNVGQLQTITFPSNYVITNSYDAAHDLRTITDNLGNRIEYEYDANGNRTDEKTYDATSTLKRHSDLSHDIRNRQQSRLQGTYLYQTINNAIGELESNIDPGTTPSVTQWVYDELGRQYNLTDALNQLIDFDYDVKDNLTQVIAANGTTTTYSYDDFGNRLSENSPDAGNQSYQYDSAGNMIQKIDGRGLVTQYSYDALNRLTQITYDDNSQAVFQYDTASNGIGKLHSITDVTGTTIYTYNVFGELTTKSQSVAGQTFTVTYNYDSNGLLDTLQYPSGLVVDYNYTSNLVSSINIGAETVLNNVTYDPFGPVTGWTWGNSNTVSKTYDQGGFPSSYSLKSKTINLGYDTRAQITALKNASTSTTLQGFDYDALYRITDYSGLGETRTFGYDPNGNRTAETLNTNNYAATVTPNSNRLQSTTGPVAKTFSYDGAGNTISDGINNYVYDVRNRLRSVNNNAKGYLINALGQRVMKYDTLTAGDANNDGQITLADVPVAADQIIQKSTALGNPDCTNDGSVTVHDIVCINNILASPPAKTNQVHFVYDEAGHLIGEYDKDGNVIKEYVWLQDTPVAVRQSATSYYIYTDHLTTPREITDTVGTVIWRWESDPFGIAQPNEDPDNNAQTFTFNLRFPGQYYDSETGLHYNYFRDYDPAIGRYITSDPIGLVSDLNTFSYVDENPILFTDIFGLSKGGKQNIGTEGFTKNSDPKLVEDALKDAIEKKQNKRIAKLRGLLKVIKRGGTMSLCPPFLESVVENILKNGCSIGDSNSCGALKLMFPEAFDELFGT